MNDKWILLTAGFSPENMVMAAERVESQATKLFPFAKIVRISRENVATYCPKLIARYPNEISDSFPGFGYAAWKTEAIYKALRGDFGPCHGIVWVDGGCEINSTFLTRIKFKRILTNATKIGHAVFALNTPERKYSKKAALDLFPKAVGVNPELQYQATYFVLHGDKGLHIAETIFKAIYKDFAIIDPTLLSHEESADLELPKCEQSLLSLAIKSEERIYSMPVPPAGNRGKKSIMRAMTEPVWVSRNRTGTSLIPKWLQLIP